MSYNYISDLIRNNKKEIINIYNISQQYTIILKEYYNKIGRIKKEYPTTKYFNKHFKLSIKTLIKNSYSYGCYEQYWFDYYYKKILADYKNGIERFKISLIKYVWQYQ